MDSLKHLFCKFEGTSLQIGKTGKFGSESMESCGNILIVKKSDIKKDMVLNIFAS
tara:strand:- start:4552 stop:4716 length:165 start_codon:yes stop_codon:yes gene_type:complete